MASPNDNLLLISKLSPVEMRFHVLSSAMKLQVQDVCIVTLQ